MPVLAKIAANDMQLMSVAEVSSILDMAIHTKAERTQYIIIYYHVFIRYLKWVDAEDKL